MPCIFEVDFMFLGILKALIQSSQLWILVLLKVKENLTSCVDLISSSSLPMKIQIMGGKMTENPV
jgi:hypothetical protein